MIITPTAVRDLEQIVRFIAMDSPEQAKRFGLLLIRQALGIGLHPEIGPILREVGDPNVREIIHGSYRIIYEVKREPAAIYILRFWHAARGTPRTSEPGI